MWCCTSATEIQKKEDMGHVHKHRRSGVWLMLRHGLMTSLFHKMYRLAVHLKMPGTKTYMMQNIYVYSKTHLWTGPYTIYCIFVHIIDNQWEPKLCWTKNLNYLISCWQKVFWRMLITAVLVWLTKEPPGKYNKTCFKETEPYSCIKKAIEQLTYDD